MMHKLFIVTDIRSIRYSDISELYHRMPKDRQSRCDSYRFETDRCLCVLSYSLLLYSLYTEYGAIKFKLGYGPNGKPYLADLPPIYFDQIHFNLSHCNQGIALALSSEPVGVDIEAFDRYDENLIDMTMSAEEAASVRNSRNCDQTFIELWTKKEAFVKYTGSGIEGDVKEILEQHREAHIRTFADRTIGCAISVCSKSEFSREFAPQYISAEDLCRHLMKNTWK